MRSWPTSIHKNLKWSYLNDIPNERWCGNVSFLHGKTVPPRIFFSPQAEVFPRAAFTPEGRLSARAKRGLVIETQGGKGCPRIHFCLRRKKYPRWDRFAMEDVTFFQFGGNSLRRVNVWKEKQLQRPKKANKRPQRPKKAKKVKSTFSYTGKKNEKSLEKNFPREEKSFFLP